MSSGRYFYGSVSGTVLLLLLGLLQGRQGGREDVLQGAAHEKRGVGGVRLGGQPGGLGGQQHADGVAVAAAGGPDLRGAAERQAAMWAGRGAEHLLWLLDLPHRGLISMCCGLSSFKIKIGGFWLFCLRCL